MAVTMETSRFLGGELGAAAEPEPEPEPRSAAAEPSRARHERRERRDSGNITTELCSSLFPTTNEPVLYYTQTRRKCLSIGKLPAQIWEMSPYSPHTRGKIAVSGHVNCVH